ncbi:MAG: class I SAM-dependent methyltransferase [Gammaproteobacteria bacterium]|nr:class I SAM-dependent methyltransferase [Gammaproteobacteria bacterium]
MLKRIYVSALRRLRSPAQRLGLLAWLERHRHRRLALWLRSLFAIYDSDDLIRLDLAWWTFAAMQQVEQFLRQRPAARVFEYGAGSSTVWLARRGARVTSVDHDGQWVGRLGRHCSGYANIDLQHVAPVPSERPRIGSQHAAWQQQDFHDYVHAIDQLPGDFDLIIIDGRCRVACLQQACGRLRPGGMILFDNAGRKRYRTALQAVPLQRQRTWGLTACLPYPDTTILLFDHQDAKLHAVAQPGRETAVASAPQSQLRIGKTC